MFSHIGEWVRSRGGEEAMFHDGSLRGGRIFGTFDPPERLRVDDQVATHFLRYGVGLGPNNTGPWLGAEVFSTEPIEFLLRQSENPLELQPSTIEAMLTPPIRGTELWLEAETDLRAVAINGMPSFFAVEALARSLGYSTEAGVGHPAEVSAPISSTLPPLSSVEQRAAELGQIAEETWRKHAWVIAAVAMGEVVRSVALVVLPIWRRAIDRVAERTAAILAERQAK